MGGGGGEREEGGNQGDNGDGVEMGGRETFIFFCGNCLDIKRDGREIYFLC